MRAQGLRGRARKPVIVAVGALVLLVLASVCYSSFSLVKVHSANVLVVGAGLSGATLARLHAELLGDKVLVIDKRDHLGGNLYDYKNQHDILISKYGAHLFHTNDELVWRFVTQFSDWVPYNHRVMASLDNKVVPLPVNIDTVNVLLGTNLTSRDEMRSWLDENQVRPKGKAANGREAAMARVGKVLYHKLFEAYTVKQWDMLPEKLDASVLERIPVRDDWDDRYFPNDKFQAQPKRGFTAFLQNMLTHPLIHTRSSTALEELHPEQSREAMYSQYEHIYFTGPIDQYFQGSGLGKLQYRSILFEEVTEATQPAAGRERLVGQSAMVVNYPGPEKNYTRVVEYRHMYNQLTVNANTTMVREYSRADGEPYYPVPNEQNRQLYARYQALAEAEEKTHNVHFVGRLANYKYFNMDAAFRNAIDHFLRLHPRVSSESVIFQAGRSLEAATAIFEPSRTEHPSVDLVISACARVPAMSSMWAAFLRSAAAPFCDATTGHRHRVFVYTCAQSAGTTLEQLSEGADQQLSSCEWHFQNLDQPSLPAAQVWLLHLMSHQFWFSHLSLFLSIGGVVSGGWEPSIGEGMRAVQQSVMSDPQGGFDAKSMRTLSMHKRGHAVFLSRKGGSQTHSSKLAIQALWGDEYGPACQMPEGARGEFVATEAAVRRMLARHRGRLLKLRQRFEEAKTESELYVLAEVMDRSWCLLFDECDC